MALRKDQIEVVFRQNKEGFLYGITYVYFKTRCVFNGSDLGKEYSAKGIQQKCIIQPEKTSLQHQKLSQQDFSKESNLDIPAKENAANILDNLIKPEIQQNAAESFELRKFKKKKGLRQQL